MSILIKGMEMPKKYPVTVTVFPDGIAVVKTISGRRFTATAIPVPPHGRLIDADAEVEVWDVCGRQGVFPHFKTTVSKFLLSHLVGKIPPTIIQAEEGEI